MRKAIFILALLLIPLAAQAQNYRVPSPAEMQNACGKTNGTWRELPAYCDHMHPRSWRKLMPEQQQQCKAIFNRPCDCGAGRRFSIVKVLGCVAN